MVKRFAVFSIVLFTVIMVTMLNSFSMDSTIQKASLTGYNLYGDSLVLEGEYGGSILKLKVEKAGKQMWYDAEILNGHFSKKILLNDGRGIYDIYLMGNKGHYEFEELEKLRVNTIINQVDITNKPKVVEETTKESFNDTQIEPIVAESVSDEKTDNQESDDFDFRAYYEEYMKEYYASLKRSENNYVATSYPSVEEVDTSVDTKINIIDTSISNSIVENEVTNQDVNSVRDQDLISEYRKDGDIRKLASKIVEGENTDMGKTRKIYDWVCANISYDRQKYMKILKSDYSDEYGPYVALRLGKGVCYDYSALVVELSNAVGLNSKLIKGDYISSSGSREYHAWNEVYIGEQGTWIPMDSTFGSVYGKDYFNNGNFYSNHEKQEIEEYGEIIRGRI